MATIPVVTASGTSEVTDIAPVELTGTDDLAQKTGRLIARNDSAGSITLNFLGDAATTYYDDDLGTVDVSGGYDLMLAAGEEKELDLNRVQPYLAGTVAVTGGATSVFAYIRS